MGKSNSKKTNPNTIDGFKSKYVKFLKAKQKKFIKSEKEASRDSVQFSFLSEIGNQEIDWKIVFEDFLEEHSDTCFWAIPMLEYFKKQFLSTEKRWLDIMFYEKFTHSITTNPGEEISIDFTSYRQSILVEKMIINNESPINQIISPKNSPKKFDPDSEVRNLAQAINKSLRKKSNPFQIIIRKFQELFLANYRKKMKEMKIESYDENSNRFKPENGINKNSQKESENAGLMRREAVVNIDYFIKLMMFCISLFYKPVIGEAKLIYLRELIINSIMNLVVRGDVYNLLFILLRIEHDEEESILARKIKDMEKNPPQQFGINEYFCLNENSPIIKVIKEAQSSDFSPFEPNKIPLELTSFDPAQSILVPESDIQRRLIKMPYKSAIEFLKIIARACTPLKKLKYIAQMNNEICTCIDEFWQGTHVNPEKLRIDADQYLSIMIYIIVKGKITDLYTHINLSAELAALGSKSKYNAYCLTTFQACFCHLLSLENDKEKPNKKENSEIPLIKSAHKELNSQNKKTSFAPQIIEYTNKFKTNKRANSYG